MSDDDAGGERRPSREVRADFDDDTSVTSALVVACATSTTLAPWADT